MTTTSRLPGFHLLSVAERRQRLAALGGEELILASDVEALEVLDKLSENVVGALRLPLSIATNFRVNGRERLVPMATEEPSVVAAASHGAKLVRAGGGFVGEADPSIMIAQVEVEDVPDPARAAAAIAAETPALLALADRAIPGLVRRGGGVRGLETRDLGEGVLVAHAYVDVLDAMGANLVDGVAEALAPRLAALAHGRIGLRILSNLALRRRVRVSARVSPDELSPEVAAAIARASRFAERDPFRAVTHNKGIMNGIDAVGLALAQDVRALEAGAHGYAAHGGGIAPLATWRLERGELVGRIELPLAVGIVGGATQAHPVARAALALLGVGSAGELALVLAAAGLATNLAALRALAAEGIQAGHLRLHARKTELRDVQ